MVLAAIAAIVVFASSTAAWATPACPTTIPSFSPDFTGAGLCLTLNGSAVLPTPAGSAASISWSGSGSTVTFTFSSSQSVPYTASEPILLSGFTTSTFFNGLAFPVLTGATPTQFQVTFTGYPGYPGPATGTDTGTATPVNLLQVTPASTGQAGSAWYDAQQPVSNAFSTTFTFQLSGGNTSQSPADGIAFVIQNQTTNPTTALGPTGCGVGFGDDVTYGECGPTTGGIPNSVAVEFKTFNDGSLYAGPYPNGANSVSIMSNGTGMNCIDPMCAIAVKNSLPNGITLADGNIHTATVSYSLQPTAAQTNCGGGTSSPVPCLDVILDGYDLFPAGVAYTMTTLNLTGGNNAYVGFTGGTGGGDDNQDVLSWTFSPQAQSQTGTVSNTQTATYTYNGGCNNSSCNGYTNTVSENLGSSKAISNLVVTPIPIIAGNGSSALANQEACNAIVDQLNSGGTSPFVNPNGSPAQTAQCFVYTNGGGQGIDAPVMFAVSCPPSGICDTTESQFFAAINTYFGFTCTENPPLIAPDCTPTNSPSSFGNFSNLTSTTGYPAVGFLQGAGPDPNNPCNPATGANAAPLFQTNQVFSYTLGDTASKPMAGGSTGLTSCWVATYDTPNVIPTATIPYVSLNGGPNQTPTSNATYIQGSAVTATYTCTSKSTDHDSILDPSGYPNNGPYLTVSSCSATSGLTVGVSTAPTSTSCAAPASPYNSSNPLTYLDTCSATISIDTTDVGPGTLTVDVLDSATNTAQQTLTYNVVPTYALTTAANPSGGGSVLPASGGSYASGTVVPVTEIANPGYVFTGWSGACSGTGACSVTMNAVESVTANFVPLYVLTTAANPSAGGIVLPASGGSYSSGTVVPVTETANPGYVFTGWSGACSGTGACSVTMNAAESVTANFVPLYVLTTAANPSAGGIVLPASGGSYTSGTVVPVTETANPGYVFTGWSGACSGTGACSVTMNAAKSVTANFGSALSISSSSLNFGTLNQGTITTQVLTLINTGQSTITMTEPFISLVKGQDDAFLILSWCGKSLAPGAKCFITVSFLAGPYYLQQVATLNVMDNAPGNPQAITLTATVVDPQASLSASSLSFGTLAPNSITTKTVTLKNTGGTTLTISNIALSGSSVFTLGSSATPCGSSLASGASCIIDVTFKPTAKASYSGTLQITDNAITGSTQKVALTGAGN